ncbi:MAG: hypothetical protein Q9172_002362 [Xanthocarpia lactea]
MQVSPAEPVRKSGRARQPNRKYANQTFTGLEALDSASEQEVDLSQPLEQRSDDDEFDELEALEDSDEEEAEAEEEQGEENEDIISSAASDASGTMTPMRHSDGAASDPDIDIESTPGEGVLQRNPTGTRSHVSGRPTKKGNATHVRGITDLGKYHSKGAKSDYIYSLFGNATPDLVHMARSRDQWCHEGTLPRRPNGNGTKGMHHYFSHTDEKRRMEATKGWDWYYDHGGQQHMSKSQENVSLSADEGVTYLAPSSDSPRTIFMGPYGRQVRFDLPILQSLPLREAWRHPHAQSDTEIDAPERPKSQKGEDGWLLNVGRGVRCVEWAPNHAGDIQYLAVSTFRPKNKDTSGQPKFSPAFTAQSFPASIQIWSFSSTKASERRSLLDPNRPPCLRLVICTDWGDAKHLRWCPMPRDFRSDRQEGKIPIGLLAGVWTDGHVRVLDVHLDQGESQRTSFVKLTAAAFTAKPPSTLCTCVIWLSQTDLAVGCANGYLALWSIYPYPALSSSASLPKPNLYTPLHASYISSLSSAYPLLPHLVATTSPSGHLRLTSLLAPQTDYVLAPRLRHPPSHIHFSEPCQAFLAADETETLRLWPIRRFFSPLSVTRCPSQGLAVGVGQVHASVILGCVDGTVCVTSPMRKFLFPRLTSWQCPIFKHEFARHGVREDDGNEGGRIRITEGFKAQEAGLYMGAGKKSVEGVVMATIYEEEGQVRCVSWGKELDVGGWVAVGMGSGLVRVEDVAI